MIVDQKLLKKYLKYDPDTGDFFWIRSLSNRGLVGQKAGWLTRTGHIEISLFNRNFTAQRLAWLYMTDDWPEGEIDHKDTVGTNNRWDNLRVATKSQQRENSRLRKDNSVGYKGVSKHKCGKFTAKIRNHYLGLYSTPEAAHEAYWAAAKLHFGEFARKE